MKIMLTIECGVDKEGRMTVDWSAECEMPKGAEPPRVDAYLAKEIMECASHAMSVKDSLNWRTPDTQPVAKKNDPDQLP